MRARIWGRRQVEERAGLASPDPWLTDALSGPPTLAGERVNQATVVGIAGVFSAVYKLAETVGSLPLKVYRTVDENDRQEAKTHRSWMILHDKPNPFTIAHTFWATVTAHLALNGNAYLFKERGPDGTLDSLWLLNPNAVRVKVDGTQRVYEVNEGIERRTYTADDICHILGFSLDGITGCSRIEYCRQTFGTALARDRYEGSFYRQGAWVSGVIEYPGRLGEDGTRNLAESFQAKHGGAQDQHKVPVLEEGASWKKVGLSLADMQFVENAQLSLTEIAVLFDLPPGELGGMHGGSLEYSTEEMNQIRLARAVVPYADRIARTLSADPAILPWNVMYCEFTIEALMRPDLKSQAEYWKFLLDEGLVEPAYAAARLNLPEPPKPKPAPAPTAAANGGGGSLPPEMVQNMQAMKAVS